MNMFKNQNKKSGCGCFLGIIAIVAVIFAIVICIMYAQNPIKLQNNLEDFSNELFKYIEKINGNEVAKEEELKLPEVEDLTGAQKYYYYQQLSETGKIIYASIENNIESLKNGEDNIKLPSSLNDIAKSNENGKELITKEFQNAWDAFNTDKQEYFYLDSSKVCLVTKITTKGSNTNYEFFIGKGDNKTYFSNNYENREQVEADIQKLQKAKDEIIKKANGNNYDKILYIHDWILENTKYDNDGKDNNSNIYGCIINGEAICEGYARAYKYLLDELDIPCVLASGTAVDENGKTERHAWNYVYINNNWYAVDTTWDDPIIIGNGKVTNNIKYKYFLKGSNIMKRDHTTSGKITNNGYEFTYPELSIEDLNK